MQRRTISTREIVGRRVDAEELRGARSVAAWPGSSASRPAGLIPVLRSWLGRGRRHLGLPRTRRRGDPVPPAAPYDRAGRATDFAAAIAHELTSPIAAIGAYAAILESPDLATADRARALARIRDEATLLHSLVADLQSVSTLERDSFSIEPVPVALASLLSNVADYAQSLPGERPLIWPQEMAERVVADPCRIGQVLRNLLINATKYAPSTTPIELRAKRRGDAVRIEVIDHGPGVHPRDTERIFEPYVRGHDHDPRIPGSGLGLYLSREIMRAHGGDLTVSPTPTGGATFAFDLEVSP